MGDNRSVVARIIQLSSHVLQVGAGTQRGEVTYQPRVHTARDEKPGPEHCTPASWAGSLSSGLTALPRSFPTAQHGWYPQIGPSLQSLTHLQITLLAHLSSTKLQVQTYIRACVNRSMTFWGKRNEFEPFWWLSEERNIGTPAFLLPPMAPTSSSVQGILFLTNSPANGALCTTGRWVDSR